MGHGPTVLVVDDEPDLADLYAAWIDEQYDIRTAYGGDEAFDALCSGIDVALIDRLMPRTSGDELLSHIRESGYDCRVAIVTAVEPDFDIIGMGFDEYLVKPIRRAEINEVLDSLVSRSEYDEKLQEFFALASKRAALRTEKNPRELEESNAYAELTAEFERLRVELERTADQLRPRDLEVEMRQLPQTTSGSDQ
ncbi:HalX domain-containing protein [Natronomonas sp. F2-12]|jgi:DNA-binding response OmpR family regulator|uniref:HalX domain-containing protein n=1 Tax=Natronomonas aquatica TaxID=2841590 RepID=A0A9R1CR11_9EURY|nr:HalX domain-containing protein [Natronomonas aquatica]MCQ4333548.1 HalX domain-containing protein [Natronomonas aquatica]